MSVSSKNDRWVTAFWLGMWLLLTSVLLFAANWQADSEKRERMSAFETQTLDLSETAEQILISRLKHYDETLLVLRDAFVADRQSFPETIKRLRSGPLADSELLVVLVDRAGYLAYTDAPNVTAGLFLGDRAYFRFFANGGKDRLYIDEPSFGRVTRRYTVPLARSIFDKNGSFLGVVAISIKQESLSNFGHGLARSADAMITVVSQSGAIVTRSRDLAGVQGTKLAPVLLAQMQNGAEGVISDHAPKDDIARTIAWQNPPGQPLILFAEAYPRDVLRESAQERTLLLTSASIASLLILILVLTLLQRRKVMIKFIGLQQAHLQEAQRIAGMGSWELVLSNSQFKWSDEVYRLFGLTRATFDPSLENFLLRVTDTDRAAVRAEIEKIITDGEGAIEFSLLRSDGQVRLMFGHGETVRDAANKVTSVIGTVRDISEQRAAEQALLRHQTQLEEMVDQRTAELRTALEAAKAADKTKDAFLANITHELRTPLSAVIGFSGLARPYCTDPRQSDYLDKINSAGKTLSGIINDLLDLSKIAAGRMDLEDSSFSLRQLLTRCISVMSFKAEEKGLELVAQVDENIPDVLRGDPLRVEQILLNLLSNAIKFTATGRIEARIGLHSRIGARICLSIEVEDSGIGLSEEGRQLLFQPFSQTDTSMSRKFGGTGLGLAICKHLAELMGGEISVSSREGSGTTFCVTLWLALGDVSELAAAEQPMDQTILPASYHDARVLVVDDQLFNREVVEGLLAVVGINPRMAGNGQEAIDQLINAGPGAFDLVLMDIQMPVMDGLTATRIIRNVEGFGELPIVAMTAHTMAHEKAIGSAAGMSGHIGKPFDDLGFYRTLAKWLPRSKYSDQSTAIPRPALAVAGNLPAMRGIDTRGGLALFVGDEARYRHWLTNFVEEAPGYVAQIRQALASGHPEQGAPLAHILKGRGGMLGMDELVTIASALETAIDTHAPASELQEKTTRLELIATQMTEEIIRALGFPVTPAAQPEPLPEALPDGPLPQSIVRLIALLEAGDGDCDIAMTRCLEELGESAWAPRLQQAQVHVQNFDFAAARKLLCAGDGANNSKVEDGG